MLGKLFGGAFGFMIGGPLGALMGAAMGHNFDQGQQQSGAKPEAVGHDSALEVFHRTAFQMMGHIAKADGRVSEREIAATRAIMEQLRLNATERQAAMADFTAGKQPTFASEAAIDAFQRACREHPAMLQPWLEGLLEIAYADGNPHPHTLSRLWWIADRLGIHRLQFETLHTLFRARRWAHSSEANPFGQSGRADYWGDFDEKPHTRQRHPNAPINSLSQAYAVLGLKRDASPADIKLAYRRLIKQHHPDKLAATNASPAELARATEKTREFTAAYDRIREARGF